MIAERQASIEGRLYLEAKQKGLNPPSNIIDLAVRELKTHRVQTNALSQKITKKHSLLENAATHCAKDILRYKETYGAKPTADQVALMVQISKVLEKRDYTHLSNEYSSYEHPFLQRKEGDLLFRQMTSREKETNTLDCTFSQTQAKSSLEATALQITREFIKINQKEICL